MMNKEGRAHSELHVTLVHTDKDFLVIDKPHGLPAAPLHKDDIYNAFSQIALEYPLIKFVRGKKLIEGGLLHRIDTQTRGLLLIACTQTAYDNFQKQQIDGRFIKYYTAICVDTRSDNEQMEKNPQALPFLIKSRFRPFGKGRMQVNPVFEGAGKSALKKSGEKCYKTEVLSIKAVSLAHSYTHIGKKTDENIAKNIHKNSGDYSNTVKVLCRITEGYRHQVRAHLAAIHMPVVGDSLYGIQCTKSKLDTSKKDCVNTLDAMQNGEPMLFFANALEFDHPLTAERITVEIPQEGFNTYSF